MLDAKTRLSELVKSAQAGEEVVIANRGEPVARLVPVRARSRRAGAGAHSGMHSGAAILQWLEDQPLRAPVRRPASALDAAVAEERGAWD